MVGRLDFVCFAPKHIFFENMSGNPQGFCLLFRDPPAWRKKQSTLVEHFIEFFLDSGSIPDISTTSQKITARKTCCYFLLRGAGTLQSEGGGEIPRSSCERSGIL